MRALRASPAALLVCALVHTARADEGPCHRLVEVLRPKAFKQGSHRVVLSPLAPAHGEWYLTASSEGPGWVEVDGKTVVSPVDFAGPRRDRETVRIRLRPSSRLEVRVPGRTHQVTVRVFGILPTSALPPGAGLPVGDVVVLDEEFAGSFSGRKDRRTVRAPGPDGILHLSAMQIGARPVLLGRVLWNDEAVLGPFALRHDRPASTSPVLALDENALDVWALGVPGSAMRVRLHGWIVDQGVPTARWESPIEGVEVDAATPLLLTFSDVDVLRAKRLAILKA